MSWAISRSESVVTLAVAWISLFARALKSLRTLDMLFPRGLKMWCRREFKKQKTIFFTKKEMEVLSKTQFWDSVKMGGFEGE
jgi:hypothetical protein